MNRFWLAISLALAVLCRTNAVEYYVAPGGSDTWTGQSPAPNAAKTDGPFASLERARDQIRKLKAAKPFREKATIYLRGGIYEIPKTFQLQAQDSSSPSAAILYPQEGEIFVFARYNWWNNIVRIAAINREERVITLASDC